MTDVKFTGVFVKLVLREEIRKLKITEFSSPYEEMIKFVDEQFSVNTLNNQVSTDFPILQ